jgi:hypothetical protein
MKHRNPIVVTLLTLITFGIYGVVLLFKTRQEKNRLDAEISAVQPEVVDTPAPSVEAPAATEAVTPTVAAAPVAATAPVVPEAAPTPVVPESASVAEPSSEQQPTIPAAEQAQVPTDSSPTQQV